jgi:alkyldihydroxyacetonephosphate synthase
VFHRAAGHFATAYTEIGDDIERLRIVTTAGNIELGFPVSAAGPDRMCLASECTLGIINEAWVKLHRRRTYRRMTSVRLAEYDRAVEATRVISQHRTRVWLLPVRLRVSGVIPTATLIEIVRGLSR